MIEHMMTEPGERQCRVCGCTDDECTSCIALTGEPCFWAGIDLCSACAPLKRAADRRLRIEACLIAAEIGLRRAMQQIDSPKVNSALKSIVLTLGELNEVLQRGRK